MEGDWIDRHPYWFMSIFVGLFPFAIWNGWEMYKEIMQGVHSYIAQCQSEGFSENACYHQYKTGAARAPAAVK